MQSRSRIIKEAKKLEYFDKCIMETEDIENDPEFRNELKNNANFNNVYNTEKGGGYWLWKPYIIYKNLKLLDSNDILIYADAGCTIPNNEDTKSKLQEYICNINLSDKSVFSFRNKQIESKWTKGDIFDYFNTTDNEKIYNTYQFTASRIIVKKNEHSSKIIEKWWSMAKENPFLFSDKPSTVKNFNNFVENRHDQSIWSLICKTMSIEEELDWNSIPIKVTRINNGYKILRLSKYSKNN